MRSALFAAACLAVAVLSLLPGAALPPVAFNVWDKAQHAAAFAALAVLGLWTFPRQPAAVVGALPVYGVFIELAQDATGWRYGDWHDWLADAVGVTLGWAARRSAGLCCTGQTVARCEKALAEFDERIVVERTMGVYGELVG